jgi:ferredoxin
MIELVSASRCIGCNLCVSVCPTNVFDAVPDAPPKIARQSDCQTCFMCELYCPVDALYVAPDVEPLSSIDETELISAGTLGSYRKDIGWTRGQIPQAQEDTSFQFSKMRR